MPKTKQVPDKGRQTLEALISVAQTKDNLAEFIAAFKKVVEIFGQMKAENAEERKQMNAWLANTSKVMERRLKELNDGKDGRDGKDGKDGVDGRNGVDGLDGKDGIMGKDGRDGSQDMAEDIRNKLELLDGDERLHFSHIGGLEDWERIRDRKDVTFINGKGPLWGLEDVNVVGIEIGQALQWNGVQWIPYTPSGSVFAGLQEQSTTTPNGSQQTFAFAHTPAIIIWNGAIQFLGIDYTVSGNNITFLTDIPQTGDIIFNIYA